jgi:TPR repeat protein
MSRRNKVRFLARIAIAAFAASTSLVFGRCSKGSTDGGGACIANSIGTLRRMTIPSCKKDAWMCRVRCIAGNAGACLSLAYQAEEGNNRDEAIRLYRRSCLLGEANACTNYAAHIWGRTHSGDELTCAQRTFEKACAAREPFACGMVGRLMIEDTTPPSFAEGRKYLERACIDVGGFPCRVLAKHLESGKLGGYEPGGIRILLQRACAGGDPDACGDPATAAETFH